MRKADPGATFAALRDVLRRQAAALVVVHDTANHYYVDAPHLQKNGKPLFFGAVKIGRQHVSYHLMPVYVYPELLDDLSPALRQRMQGKSCFNFKAPEPELLTELAELTRRGLERYRTAGYLR